MSGCPCLLLSGTPLGTVCLDQPPLLSLPPANNDTTSSGALRQKAASSHQWMTLQPPVTAYLSLWMMKPGCPAWTMPPSPASPAAGSLGVPHSPAVSDASRTPSCTPQMRRQTAWYSWRIWNGTRCQRRLLSPLRHTGQPDPSRQVLGSLRKT